MCILHRSTICVLHRSLDRQGCTKKYILHPLKILHLTPVLLSSLRASFYGSRDTRVGSLPDGAGHSPFFPEGVEAKEDERQ
jgi:hypothetical protein